MITQQQVLELFEYRDGNLYWKVKPAKQVAVGAKAGCKNSYGYCVVRVDGVLYGAHRIVFLMHHGYLPDYIDHIDGNPLNNRIENLRQATNIENCYNRGKQSNNKSGCKNVHWKAKIKHWSVEIQVNKVKRYLGIYKDFELAELVAQEARDLYHGSFAKQGA